MRNTTPRWRIALCRWGGLLALGASVGCPGAGTPDAIWCETGVGPGQVVYPRAISYDGRDDSFWIVDRMARVQHLNRDGRPLGEWRMPQYAAGKPVGISIGPDGNVWVPDTHYGQVRIYSPGGEPLATWGSFGTAPGQFVYPTDIAFDDRGRVFVGEYGDNDRIQVFDLRGNRLYQFGRFGQGDGEFSRPQSLVVDGDLIYVADACNHRIVVFTLEGQFVRNIGRVGSGPGEFRFPYGLDLDAEGNLVVCEFGNNRVQRIDKRTGQSLGAWGANGREPGQLSYPWAVAVDRRGRIVAVDSGNNRLQVFRF